jgi:integrase
MQYQDIIGYNLKDGSFISTIFNMTPTRPPTVPSKKTIQESFHGASTRRAYTTYQKQFEAFIQTHQNGIDPGAAGIEECTDFFHHLYSQGKKARTIDLAKSALVAYFNARRVTPNPAQDTQARRYIVGLQKYNKHNNVDEEKKAHPLTVHELSTLMNAISRMHPFVGSMLRLLLAVSFLGCFRICEVLALRWNDVQIVTDSKGRYLSVRLRWHKKANVEEDCQVYHLVDEPSFPCLLVCGFHDDYNAKLRSCCLNLTSTAFVFPNIVIQQNGVPKVEWYRGLEQANLRKWLGDLVEATPDLPIGISLHSLRRGGSFYRVFESQERRFNFRELMAWCRWADAKTCCEYLVTQSISNEIDPRNLLRNASALHPTQWPGIGTGGLPMSVDALGQALAKSLQQHNVSNSVPSKVTTQRSMDMFVAQKSIPTARSAREAWQQWFVADPDNGLVCALKNYSKEMIRMDRKKYSERLTLAVAFSKFQTFDQFEAAYMGFTASYAKILREIRFRKRNATI